MRAAVLVLGAALSLIDLDARAEAQPSEAERLYYDGQEAYDQHRYDAALALWHRSYELSQLPALLFNLGQAYRLRGAAGDCARATESYRQFLQLAPDSTQRATTEALLRELRDCAKAPPPAPPDPARRPDPSSNGPLARTQPSDPGSRQLETSEGSSSKAGPEPSGASGRAASTRLAGAIAAGGGAAAVLVGMYYGARARRLGDEVTEACADGCVWSSVAARDAEGRSAERTQWILYGVGAGGLIAGAALYYLGARGRAPAVALVPRRGGGLLAWSRRW